MPELPEVERARATIEAGALGRRVVAVDDTDTWECRPHQPGDIEDALVGRELTAAHRIGKSMWCETSAKRRRGGSGPTLGIHLGMSGRMVVAAGASRARSERTRKWNRFTITFADGGQLRLHDKRRLGRVRLDPDLDALGPDAERVGLYELQERVGRGRAPLKARLLDQSVLAGIGNLLADETLWQAGLSPQRPSGELTLGELDDLHGALQRAIRSAIQRGGVHTGELIRHRRRDGHCPRCGAELSRATVGGRTTYWCPVEQA